MTIHRPSFEPQGKGRDLLPVAPKTMILHQPKQFSWRKIMAIKNMPESLKRTNTGAFVKAESCEF